MGFHTLGVNFLLQARARGLALGNTLTLGHQAMFVSPVRLAKLLKQYGLFPAGTRDEEFYKGQFSSPYFGDALLRVLGATQITSLDFSVYEGASIAHDLNTPIGDAHKERFDTIIDGGTLEHVFNFPVAIKNCMEMLKVGGTLFIITPANNHFGHGFYQFSAELFYRVLSAENGFEVQRIHAAESEIFATTVLNCPIAVEHHGRVYSIADPAQVHDRVYLATKTPVYMLVEARRIDRKPIFQKTPQQSNYQTQW